MTREEINELNIVEPYCFETDREEQWYDVGLKEGLTIADKSMIEKACVWIERHSYVGTSGQLICNFTIEDFKKAMEETK